MSALTSRDVGGSGTYREQGCLLGRGRSQSRCLTPSRSPSLRSLEPSSLHAAIEKVRAASQQGGGGGHRRVVLRGIVLPSRVGLDARELAQGSVRNSRLVGVGVGVGETIGAYAGLAPARHRQTRQHQDPGLRGAPSRRRRQVAVVGQQRPRQGTPGSRPARSRDPGDLAGPAVDEQRDA